MTDTKHTAAQPLDLDKLEALAKVVGGVRFETEGFEQIEGRGQFYGGLIMSSDGETIVAQCVLQPWADFIAAANPAVILQLIAQARAARPTDDVMAAAWAVVQDAIDSHRAEVHPCDRENNDLAVRACSSEIQLLHAALKGAARLDTTASDGVIYEAVSRRADPEGHAEATAQMDAVIGSAARPELTVWYGPMPESNGKSNFTAILKRKGASFFDASSYTFARSEYPDRVRYEADCMRYLIGEIAERPDILDYDADKHSGYVAPVTAQQAAAKERLVSDGKGGFVPAEFVDEVRGDSTPCSADDESRRIEVMKQLISDEERQLAAAKAPAAQAVDAPVLPPVICVGRPSATANIATIFFDRDVTDAELLAVNEALKSRLNRPAASPASTPEVSQQAAAVAAPSEPQANVMPPFAAPASQHAANSAADEQWIFDLAAEHEANRSGLYGPVTFDATGLADFAHAIEAEVARRFRAQGGITSAESCSAGAATTSEDAQIGKWLIEQGFKHANVDLTSDGDGDPIVIFEPRFYIPEPVGMSYDDGEWTVDDIRTAIRAAMRATQQEGGNA